MTEFYHILSLKISNLTIKTVANKEVYEKLLILS